MEVDVSYATAKTAALQFTITPYGVDDQWLCVLRYRTPTDGKYRTGLICEVAITPVEACQAAWTHWRRT